MNLPIKPDSFISNYIEARLTKLETIQENVNQTLVEIKQSISKLDTTITKEFNDARTESMQNFTAINNRIWSNFYWMLAGFVSVITLCAHIAHWI